MWTRLWLLVIASLTIKVSPSYIRPPVRTSSLDSTTERLTYDDIYARVGKSDGYGYEYAGYDAHIGYNDPSDRCKDFDTIGIGAGAASLLALGTFLLLTNNGATITTMTMTNMTGRSREGADPWLARSTITATCAGADLLTSEHPLFGTALATARIALDPYSVNRTVLHRKILEAGMGPLPSENGVIQSRPTDVGKGPGRDWKMSNLRFEGRDRKGDGDGCFSEIIGALAGLASLGALAGYSLAQSSRALMTAMMTIMTTTMTGRQLTDVFQVDPVGLKFVSGMVRLLTTPEDVNCSQFNLCMLVQESKLAGPPYDSAVPLASMPLSWLMSKTSGQSFSDLCWTIQESQDTVNCSRLYPRCPEKR